MEEIGILIVLVLFLAILVRVIAGSIDTGRVEAYVRKQGGELVDKSWDPFGPGWFSEKNMRIYQIVYRDKGGNFHQAHVKTAMFSGVYLTNDRIIENAKPAPSSAQPDKETLRAENERLKAKILELEKKSESG